MADVKDLNQEAEKEKQQEIEKAQKSTGSFQWSKVPKYAQLGGIAVLALKYISITQNKGNMNELWMWVVFVIVVWFILGTWGKTAENTILTPEEADIAARKEIARKIKDGQISKNARWFLGPNNGLFHSEGLPQHYLIQLEIIEDYYKEYKRCMVFAQGNTKGFVTIQDTLGKLDGRTPVPVISPLPVWAKRMQKAGLDIDKYIMGGGGDKPK